MLYFFCFPEFFLREDDKFHNCIFVDSESTEQEVNDDDDGRQMTEMGKVTLADGG